MITTSKANKLYFQLLEGISCLFLFTATKGRSLLQPSSLLTWEVLQYFSTPSPASQQPTLIKLHFTLSFISRTKSFVQPCFAASAKVEFHLPLLLRSATYLWIPVSYSNCYSCQWIATNILQLQYSNLPQVSASRIVNSFLAKIEQPRTSNLKRKRSHHQSFEHN
jgi:hypothetical protein